MSDYVCSECGTVILVTQRVCPECGSEIAWEEAVGRTSYVHRLPRFGPPRGPKFGRLILYSLAITGILLAVTIASLWGLERGLQQRRASTGDVVFDRYRQSLLHLLDGDIRSAQQEFNANVGLELRNPPPPTLLPLLETSPTTNPVPSPTPLPPTNTPAVVQQTQEQIRAQAQAMMEEGNWPQAISYLLSLRDMEPGYQSGPTGQMLFNAHYRYALQLEEEGDMDGTLRELDQALALRPGNTAATELKHTIELYQSGVAQMGIDWDAAIAALSELFVLNPDFQDIADQLFLAYAGSGDHLRRSDPCEAANHYRQALQLDREPQVRAKLEDARVRCGTFTNGLENGEPLPPATGGPTPITLSGTIAYTFFDEVRTYHNARLWDVLSGRPGAIIASEALQPDMGPDGQFVVRATGADDFGLTVYNQDGTIRRLTGEAGDSQPRWSPEGTQILFSSISRTNDRRSHIFVLDIETNRVRDIGLGQSADWSPDGNEIVYEGCGEATEKCGLWILNLSRGERRQITTSPGDAMPAWSPDGQYIAFMSDSRSPGWDIFVIEAQSGTIPFFALDDAIDGLPVWSPDGAYIAFISDREGDWAVYAWSLEDLTVTRILPIGPSLPAWWEAGVDWYGSK